MGQIIHKTGNIFTSYSQAIGHGVNVYGVMGHGIAVQFRNNFPRMYDEYRDLCKTNGLMPGSVFIWSAGTLQGGKEGFVYNIASQDAPGANADYGWLLSGVHRALTHADEHQIKSVSLPRIGAGVGGLEWEKVLQVLELVASWHTTDLEIWSLPDAK